MLCKNSFRVLFPNQHACECGPVQFRLYAAMVENLVLTACRCVEIGSGSGYVTCSLARLLQHHNCTAFCIATDISPHAVAATKATLAAHQVCLLFHYAIKSLL